MPLTRETLFHDDLTGDCLAAAGRQSAARARAFAEHGRNLSILATMLHCGKPLPVIYGPRRNTTRRAVIRIGAKYLRRAAVLGFNLNKRARCLLQHPKQHQPGAHL